MYEYINILSTSIFFMSLYVLYGNYKSSKGKKYIIPLVIISTILIYRFGYMLEGYNILAGMNSNYICEILIILFIMQFDEREKINKKNKLLVFINYILGVISVVIYFIQDSNICIQIISIYLIMTTLYLFSANVYTSRSKNKNTIIIMIYFIYILCSLVIGDKGKIINIGDMLNLVSGVYIFISLFKNNVSEIYNQKLEVNSKLRRSNITMKIHDEKLNMNKNFSEIIYKNLEKKNKILDLILDQCNRCVLLIDDEGYILNEDDGFSKMWKEYKDCKYKINLTTFLNRSIRNQSDFIRCINQIDSRCQEIYGELEGKDGRFFSCTYAPFIIQDKKIGVICVINDITYKKKSEIKIKENDVKYKKIVDNIPYSILLTNSNDILYNNEKNEYIDFYKTDIKNIIIESSTSGELHYTSNNGVETCLNIDRVSFLEGGDNRNLIVIRDITDYKKLIQSVEYNKKKYEALVNIIPEGIYISNFENKIITYANTTLLDMLGSEDIEEVDLDSINESTVITSGTSNDSVKFERNIIKNRYGEEIHIESGAMLVDVNQRLKLIGIVRDITDQIKAEIMEREIEEKKRANKIKNEFFINMSHELKTPLNLIHSSNQLIEALYKEEISKNPKGELSQATAVVQKHLYMLMALINNIMDLAKLESDFHYVKKDYYNIVDIIEDVVYEFNKCISINNINIVFDTDEEERIANIDPQDIEKIILTLLSIIIRYSSDESTINVDLNSSFEKTTISIKNIGGYDYSRYMNDQEKRNLDIGITVTKLMIDLYNGNIDIKTDYKNEISIIIGIEVDEKAKNYKKRSKNLNDELLYAEYIRMCNF